MKAHWVAAVAAGWFLVIPPDTRRAEVDVAAPLQTWLRFERYDSDAWCEADLGAKRRANAEALAGTPGHHPLLEINREVLAAARCIEE